MSSASVAGIIDAALELTVAPGFTRAGYAARRRLDEWKPLGQYDLTGRTVLVTGATSGLGMFTATQCAELGATVIVTGRDRARTEQAAATIPRSIPVAADMGEPEQVRQLATAVGEISDRLDVLVHNAGALSHGRHTNSDGVESTVASQVVGPYLLTCLLLERLAVAKPGRVITVSSGGMYTAPLTVSGLQMPDSEYSGSRQYTLAKRAQVTLNEMWAAKVAPTDVVFHAMHPGWADTAGVRASLPRFRAVTKPLLRSAEEGADTTVWLACDQSGAHESGGFWHDRRRRPIHRLPSTRRSDTSERRARLWEWCIETAGVDPVSRP